MKDTDWEALELLDEVDPEEAAGLRAYKEACVREREAAEVEQD